jgi:glycosyltransferase involved in cell wall biosynthesis
VNFARYDAIVVLHETWDAVYCGSVLAKQLNLPSAVLLHNPPFYGSRKRFLNILKSILLWRKLVSSNLAARALLEVDAVVQNFIGERLSRLRYPKLLREYTLVLGSTKATAIEMGGEWIRKMFCFDPGYSLSNEDLEVIKSIGSKIKKKENYIVFGGRPSAEKGFAEALISFKRILKHFPKMRLVVGGRAPISFVRRSVKRLNVEDKVVFTGFVPREKWFEIVAKARLMLYPSHVDAFSYAVLESLHLKTPVVAYRIPAIEIYHGKAPGIQLVEEGDLEAFTVKAIDVLEKGVEAIEPPKIKSWKEIMSEEIEIISKLART